MAWSVNCKPVRCTIGIRCLGVRLVGDRTSRQQSHPPLRVTICSVKCVVTPPQRPSDVGRIHSLFVSAVVTQKVDSNKITATDYAVYIEGLPKTAGRREIGQFFRYLPTLEEYVRHCRLNDRF